MCLLLDSITVAFPFCYGNSENNVDQALLQSAVPVISAVLQEHLRNRAVTEAGCSALWALSLQGVFSQSSCPLCVEKAHMPNTSVWW